jgi:hypothetical protein
MRPGVTSVGCAINLRRIDLPIPWGNEMDSADRTKLKKLALERLESTADDKEEWSFLFRTKGSVGLIYCPWSTTDDWDFDGDIEGLPWIIPERRDAIKQGTADPTEEELGQWRQAKCRELAAGSDWVRPAWIVPLTVGEEIAGWALFLCDEYSPPISKASIVSKTRRLL